MTALEVPDALRAAGLFEGLPDVRYAGRLSVPAYSPLRGRGPMFEWGSGFHGSQGEFATAFRSGTWALAGKASRLSVNSPVGC